MNPLNSIAYNGAQQALLLLLIQPCTIIYSLHRLALILFSHNSLLSEGFLVCYTGLDVYINQLETVDRNYYGGISKADLWALCAVEAAYLGAEFVRK